MSFTQKDWNDPKPVRFFSRISRNFNVASLESTVAVDDGYTLIIGGTRQMARKMLNFAFTFDGFRFDFWRIEYFIWSSSLKTKVLVNLLMF